MHTTNYVDTFLTIAPDSTATRGVEPPKGVARLMYDRIVAYPYRYTSDDVIHGVHIERKGDEALRRDEFFAKGQACLRASDLGKKYGWGIHHDAQGRVALYGVESKEYAEFASGKRKATVKPAMRSSRKA